MENVKLIKSYFNKHFKHNYFNESDFEFKDLLKILNKKEKVVKNTVVLPDVSGWRLLHLSLKKDPFNVMITGEKPYEFRKPTKWIKSRLFDNNGTRKEYDGVKFVNGYGDDKPYFIARFKGFSFAPHDYRQRYSTGLNVEVEYGDIEIKLGEVVLKGNA